MAADLTTVKNALRNNRKQLLDRTNVVAVGVGYKITGGKKTDSLGIVCSVKKKVAASQLSSADMVPATLDGMPTDIIETGIIRALQSPTEKHRPAPGGVSIGHRDITAGTLGCLVKKDGRFVILSNNHVLANSNAAEIGDAILQPGPHDVGRYPEDHIADLEQLIQLTSLVFRVTARLQKELPTFSIAFPDFSEVACSCRPLISKRQKTSWTPPLHARSTRTMSKMRFYR